MPKIFRRFATIATRSAWFGVMIFLLAKPASAVDLTVGASGASFTTIQAAVNACPAEGCNIVLIDTVYKLGRELWIEGKNGLTIKADRSLQIQGIRPRLYYSGLASEFLLAGTAINPTDPDRPAGWKKWPTKGTSNTGLGGAGNTVNPYSTSGFQHNGYIVIYKSTGITIDGIMVDGLKSQTFRNQGIWSDKYDVFFGNVGINLFQSKKVTISNTEVKNCFAAVYMQNRNVGGAFAAPNPNDLDKDRIIPYSQYGKMGDHLIERNYMHDNWYVIYDEMEWDIGSTIRYNIFDQNYNKQFAQNQDSAAESNNMVGGFLYVKDVTIVPHKIYNNTINGSSVVLGHGHFKPGVQHYFYNNLVTNWNRNGINAGMIKDMRQLLLWYKDFMYNNTFEVGAPDSLYQIQQVTSGQVSDPAVCADAGQTAIPCWINLDKPINALFGIKNQWLWNGWEVMQGANLKAEYTLKKSPGTVQLSIFNNQAIDTFQVGGIISKAQGLGAAKVDISRQANYWARTVPYLSKIPGNRNFLEPSWDSGIVAKTILDKGWDAAGNKDADGTLPDRGAVPRTRASIISPLTLRDQSIVTLDPVKKTVSFQYCLEGSGNWSNVGFDMVSYYNNIARSTEALTQPAPNWPAPVQLVPTGAKPTVGDCNLFTASLPVAPADSFARFDLVVKGDLNGVTTKSNVGVWIWRKTAYRLDVFFLDRRGDTVTNARVGDSLTMYVRGLRTDGSGTQVPIDLLAATPDRNMFLVDGPKQVMPGDTIGRGIPAAGKGFPVYFTQTGIVTVSLSGKYQALPIPGYGSIIIRPGLPEKVIWQKPPTYSLLDHAANKDSIATAMPQSPSAVELQVVDKFNNPVDTSTAVTISAAKIDPAIFDFGFAATATDPFANKTGPWELTSDSEGKLAIQHVVHGLEGQKYWGFATVKGKTAVDSALMKVGKPLERLFFNPIVAIDTFVTIRRPVRIIVSEDGQVVKAGTSYAAATVKLGSALGTSFYLSEAATNPIDSVVLAAGEATVWVTSRTPVKSDTLFASHLFLGQGLPAMYAPVSFRMPPLPPAPVPSTAGFVDRNCDAVADSIEVELKDLQGGSNKLTSKVTIDSIHVVYGGSDTWIKTGWRIVPTDSSKVRVKVPGTPGVKSDLTGSIRFAYTVARPPILDTSYITGVATIADRMGPRLIDTAYVTENFDHVSVADTVKLLFSEPMNFTAATGWAFTVVDGSGAPVNTATLSVQAVVPDATDPRRYRVVFKGNTNGSLLAQGYKIRISAASTLVDAAGNTAGGAECAPGVPVVELPSPVPFHSAWIKDEDGDGRADRVYVRFVKPANRSMAANDVPNSFRVSWAGNGDTATVGKAAFTANADSTVYGFAVGPFAKGATITGASGGVGKLELFAPGRNGETYSVIDSVLPIPTSARLTYGPTKDTLIVQYSEPMTKISGNVWMVHKNGASDENMDLSDATGNASGTTWTFLIAHDGQGYAQPGDSVRLPLSDSRLSATNNNVLPSATALSPYVQVMGGDRAPSKAWYQDTDGNGIADRVEMVFTRPLRTSPTFTFRIGSEKVEVKETAGLTIGADRKTAVVDLKAGAGAFTQIVTWVDATDSLGTIVSGLDNSTIVTQKFPVLDSIDPVISSAHVAYSAYGKDNEFDTLRLKFSEPVTLGAGNVLVAGTVKASGETAPVAWDNNGGKSRFLAIDADSVLVFCDTSCVDNVGTRAAMPGRGDSIRIASVIMGGIVSDANGNRPEDVAKWTKVTAGDRPLAFNVSIYPTGLHVQAGPKDGTLKKLPSLTMWAISTDGKSFEQIQNGRKTGLKMDVETMAGNGLGLLIDLNTPLHAKAILYDKLGVFVDQLALDISREDLARLAIADNSGKYKIYVFFNGMMNENEVGSGVYVARFVTFHEVLMPDQTHEMRMLGNEIFNLGYRGSSK